MSMSGSAATVLVRAGPGDGSLSTRLKAVEVTVRRIDERITATEHELRRDLQAVRALVEEVRLQSEARSSSISLQLERYSTGSLDWELVGVVWVVWGQAFGSFPAEIGKGLARLALRFFIP